MKRRPALDDDADGGLDSLLDTMTNVVGILVMVLIATQLGVRDAVSRISESAEVDPAAIAASRERLKLSRQQRDALKQQLADLKPADENAIEVQLADLRRRKETVRTNLQTTNETANQYAAKIEDDKQKAAAATKKIEDMEKQQARMDSIDKEITDALKNESQLKALLDDTPEQQAPPPKVVTLPDPRPAPDGVKPLTFLCANNKIYPVDISTWQEKVRSRVEYIVNSKRLYGGPEVGVPEDKFMVEFNKTRRTLRDDYVQLELYSSGIYPRLKFLPDEKSGATVTEVLKPRSRFQKILAGIDPNKYYARFYVLPDSFEVYLAARSVADQANLLAGWEPQPEDWNYTAGLGGPLLFGPKPKPNPDAKPKPPAKPANVID